MILALYAVLMLVAQTAAAKKKTQPVLSTLRGYPSGVIDEYHFHGGTAVLRGRFVNMPGRNFSTFVLEGTDQFTNQEFVRSITIDADGTFLEQVRLPHSGWFYFQGAEIQPAFIAVGDTLDITIDGTQKYDALLSGSGATGEVNRIWPELYKQFKSDETRTPWEGLDRDFMLAWKSRKVKEQDHVARVIDADTLSLLRDCSPFARDVLKTSLLLVPFGELCEAAQIWSWKIRSDDGKQDPALVIRLAEWFDFLSARQAYLLDNPLVLFADDGGHLINAMEFYGLNAYLFLRNAMVRWTKSTDSDELGNYKANFILPHDYDAALHREMLEYDKGRLLTVSDYYAMASDSIRTRYGLDRTGFMMQLCLLHRVLDFDEEGSPDWYLNKKAEELAGAMPQFTDPAICHHAIDAYRRFVVEREGRAVAASSAATPGDSIFQSLLNRYAGNVIYMDFWGIGCGPCRAGMLEQRALVEQYKDAPVRFLYLCNEKDSPREPSEKFLTDNNIQGEHLFLTSDEWNHLATKFQFYAIPFSLLIDRKGNIVEKNVAPTAAKIDELLD